MIARRIEPAIRSALRSTIPIDAYTYRELGAYGRLGNQLHEIAATIGMARDRGKPAFFTQTWAYRHDFSMPRNLFASRFDVARCEDAWRLAESIELRWRPYLQDIELWEEYRDEVARMFQPNCALLAAAAQKYREALSAGDTTAVHVRRTDFLEPNRPRRRACPPDYYELAVAEVLSEAPQTRFLVFSDDAAWCREHLPIVSPVFVEGNSAVLDLALMRLCRRHICANSTFSWWGAFLSDDPSPIYPWLRGVLPRDFKRYPSHWREIEIEAPPMPTV